MTDNSSAQPVVTAARDIGFRFVLSAAFAVLTLSGGYFLSWMGSRSANQFVLVDGSGDEGAQLGVAFGVLTGVLVFGTGMLCFIRVDTYRYAIPGWVAQIVVIALGLFSLLLGFLFGLGGLAGPPADQSWQAEYARSLRGWLPQFPLLGVVAMVETALIFRTLRLEGRTPGWRVPLVFAAVIIAAVVVLVGIAWGISPRSVGT
ncbi:hypothetical protein HD599_000966 [Conyzicola lurida]|uniref:Uncharacterized protein n=1 Tax=Conyzicola lurida TaxID=1172621 RepID=A0A841ALY1_9MICO|nr:hypothetical protein [Conyzicola lurida]MBB5842643.1 hypothetical protein [Conyzicola lurida]